MGLAPAEDQRLFTAHGVNGVFERLISREAPILISLYKDAGQVPSVHKELLAFSRGSRRLLADN